MYITGPFTPILIKAFKCCFLKTNKHDRERKKKVKSRMTLQMKKIRCITKFKKDIKNCLLLLANWFLGIRIWYDIYFK
jgi:hypothetical protein